MVNLGEAVCQYSRVRPSIVILELDPIFAALMERHVTVKSHHNIAELLILSVSDMAPHILTLPPPNLSNSWVQLEEKRSF